MRYLGKFEIEILKYVVVLVHILEKVLYNPGIPVFIILERHCHIVMWYYHMPRVSQLFMISNNLDELGKLQVTEYPSNIPS